MVRRLLHELISETDIFIFDVDGTLVDSHERNREACIQVLAQLETMPGVGDRLREEAGFREELRAKIFDHSPGTVVELYLKGHVGVEELREMYVTAYAQAATRSVPYPGAIETLTLLSSQERFVTFATGASNIVFGYNLLVLNEAGMSVDTVQATVHDEHENIRKPKQGALDLLLMRLSTTLRISRAELEHCRTMMVGDTVSDFRFAELMDAPFAYTHGDRDPAAHASPRTYPLPSIAEFHSHVQRAFGE